MSWTTGYGFNFRNTSGYVTDGAQELFWRGGSQTSPGGWGYPDTVYSEVVAGWESSLGTAADVNSSLDRRLAGRVTRSATTATFRIDLPATGSYELGLAFSSASTNTRIEVLDDTTSLFVLTPATTADYADANGTIYTAANWPTSQTLRSITMATTALRITVGNAASGHGTNIHHIFVRQAGSGGGNKFRPYFITG